MIEVKYNNAVIASLKAGQKATLHVKERDMEDDIIVSVPEAEDNPLPIEISTEAEMTALLETAEIGSVYKYTGITGTYENGVLYVVEAKLITFTISGAEHQAEEGMTWEQWCESKYNSLGVYVSGNYVVGTTSDYYICSDVDTSTSVNKTNTIIEGHKYYLTDAKHGSGGSND